MLEDGEEYRRVEKKGFTITCSRIFAGEEIGLGDYYVASFLTKYNDLQIHLKQKLTKR